ncbi:hypothetical protein AXF42_Ash012472 [Apostasia shenzhenica]|uniref:Uncharacterized protein n=1 Tax=Apostasia shenzhenica TaxID=1088818 RepID=A0A2I0AQV1_9ASPA|nr:hypothetical protein AXF42_Ash012472 [Apostasia shenzhenica]
MGNCQASEAAAATIQLPDGRVERLFWPTSAEEVMRSHPGHYVAQVTLSISGSGQVSGGGSAVRFTRVRLLKHKEMLLNGNVYRLITAQDDRCRASECGIGFSDVTNAARARKNEKIRKVRNELIKRQQEELLLYREQQRRDFEGGQSFGEEAAEIASQKTDHVVKLEKERQRSSRYWRPSLQSIAEVGS